MRTSAWAVLAVGLLVAACESPLAPVPCGAIPQVTAHVGEDAGATVCFNDANGDALHYTAVSSNPSVAAASVAGAQVTVSALAPGSATVTLTASDPGGLRGQQSFQVVVPNRPPRALGTIPEQLVKAGEAAVVELASWFEEPDGQPLTFHVMASDAEVAGLALSGGRLALEGLAKGTTDVTATATDPGGLQAEQTFRFEVPNRGPAAVGTIEGQIMQRGETRRIDLLPWFADPDGEPLRYAALSSNPAAVTATAPGAVLDLAAVATGRATVTVTARDPGGLTATHTFIAEVPNRPPVALGGLPDVELAVGGAVRTEVLDRFSDPDGDVLVYSASSSNPEVAEASMAGSALTVAARRAGMATISVTATDPDGLSAIQQLRVTVSNPNRPPRPQGSMPGQTIAVGERATVILPQFFTDPDGDDLAYSASSSEVGIATAAVFGSTLELSGEREGLATITVAATDPGGLSATSSFPVTVTGDEQPPGAFRIELRAATEVTATVKAAFQSAAARWMAILEDTELPDMPVPEGMVSCRFSERTYEQAASIVDDLMIVAAVAEIDGAGATLGRAGPCALRDGSLLPWLGLMEFDGADLEWMEANGILESVILHEMGHVLGIGTIWHDLGLLRNPSLAAEREVDTHFAGALAIRAFDGVGGHVYAQGAKVPVENRGTRPGSDDSHWRGIVFGPELMTPSIEPGLSPLSRVTAASLADLGYAVRLDLADAYRLPGAAALLAHQRRAIELGNDVIRLPLEVRDGNGRVVGIIRP